MNKIILTGGGSAGHCVPNIAILPQLGKHFDEILYIGSKSGIEKTLIEQQGLLYFPITTTKLIRNFNLKNLTIPFQLVKSVNECTKILKKVKPNVVFSKGGFVSLPVVLSAKKLNIPIVIHECDFTMGLANKLSLKSATKVLTSFEQTKNDNKKTTFTGCPLRSELFNCERDEALAHFNFDGKKPIVVLIGGSLGSVKLNNALVESLPNLLPTFDLLHLTGKNKMTNFSREGYCAVEFSSDMAKVYALGDVFISRSGANSLFELMALKKPTIFIPLCNKASRGDQLLNADYFAKKGMALLLEEKNLTKDSLTTYIQMAYSDRFNLKNKLCKNNLTSANEKIVENILSVIKH